MPHQLHPLRNRIDRLDDRLVTLLLKRFDLVRKIGAVKAALGDRIYHPRREREILARISKRISPEKSKSAIRAIYRTLMAESRKLQDLR